MSGQRDHASLGASNASRWMNCPGSVAAEEGQPNPSSAYADEGTAAHELAALALKLKRDPKTWLGTEIEVTDEDGTRTVLVTEDMVDGVRVYVDYVRDLIAKSTQYAIERKFDLAPIKPPVPMFGTADFGGYNDTTMHLDIADLKFGKGVRVDAKDNQQVRYYALGFWIELAVTQRALAMALKSITVHIVQPRILDEDGNPTITTETISLQTLKAFARDLLEHARRTQMSDAPRVAGSWCTFCRAKATCPAFRSKALAVAQAEFSDLAEDRVKLPAPGDLTPEQVAKVLQYRDLLTDWLSSVEAYALNELERGRPVPGWSRKPKRQHRKWGSEAAVVTWATEELGADEDDIYDRKLKTPAQVEKLLPKGTKVPDTLLAKQEPTGYNLCPADDPKALPPAAVTDFDVLN